MKYLPAVRSLLAIFLTFLPVAGISKEGSLAGTWITYDENSGVATSKVEITERNGAIEGRIVKLIGVESSSKAVCDKCEGDRKNKRVEGLIILWGVKREGRIFTDGRILDPRSGKSYDVRITPSNGGTKLELRAYIGTPFAGQSVFWRLEGAGG